MDRAISCPACNTPISVNQLFRTATLLRFKCPNCATRLQPVDNKFATAWLVIAAGVGFLAALAAVAASRLTVDVAVRSVAYVGLIILVAGAVALIKWRASLALIKKGRLKVAT